MKGERSTVRDKLLRKFYLLSAKAAEVRVLGERDRDYNRGDVDVEDYANFAPENLHPPTYWPLIYYKTTRYRSHLYGNASDAKKLETLADLVNYALFEMALIRLRDFRRFHGMRRETQL